MSLIKRMENKIVKLEKNIEEEKNHIENLKEKPVIVVLFGGFVLSETSAQETALYVSEEGNYSLRPDFPALKLGFKPVDLSRVCLRGGAQ